MTSSRTVTHTPGGHEATHIPWRFRRERHRNVCKCMVSRVFHKLKNTPNLAKTCQNRVSKLKWGLQVQRRAPHSVQRAQGLE